MPDVMKTLLLNPPSFEGYDGGASSRWPATREIESYWYPVWLAYPAGLLEGSRLLDASPHKVSPAETIRIARDYEFVVLFTSTAGFDSDLRLAKEMKAAKRPDGFYGFHVTSLLGNPKFMPQGSGIPGSIPGGIPQLVPGGPGGFGHL